jgi:serine/threonine protein kinase
MRILLVGLAGLAEAARSAFDVGTDEVYRHSLSLLEQPNLRGLEAEGECPPRRLFLDIGDGHLGAINVAGPIEGHYKSENPSVYLKEIVETFRMGGEELLFDMARERTALKMLENDPDVPQVYPITNAGPSCETRMLVMSIVGTIQLRTLWKHVSADAAFELIPRIATKAIGILKRVHAKGLVHGDVHGGNFMLNNYVDPQSLQIIDFGFAESYVDGEGWHRPDLPRDQLLLLISLGTDGAHKVSERRHVSTRRNAAPSWRL